MMLIRFTDPLWPVATLAVPALCAASLLRAKTRVVHPLRIRGTHTSHTGSRVVSHNKGVAGIGDPIVKEVDGVPGLVKNGYCFARRNVCAKGGLCVAAKKRPPRIGIDCSRALKPCRGQGTVHGCGPQVRWSHGLRIYAGRAAVLIRHSTQRDRSRRPTPPDSLATALFPALTFHSLLARFPLERIVRWAKVNGQGVSLLRPEGLRFRTC
jgi:hypothetical protein